MFVNIGGKKVGPGYPCFIVAEIGINHNGSLEIAKKLIDVAKEAGCDAVKFQKRTVNIVYSEEELKKPRSVDKSIILNALARETIDNVKQNIFPEGSRKRLTEDISNTTNGDLKYALEFGLKEYDEIDLYCRERNILWYASSWDGISAHFVNGFNVPCHKIASPCLTHKNLLERVRYNGKPVILSTGGSILEQVEKAVKILGKESLIILHCVAEYPPDDERTNMLMMDTLTIAFRGVPIGYSGHEADNMASIVAVAKGACMIERHITLDKNMPGSDHKASIEPQELKDLVAAIRRIEKMTGNGIKKVTDVEKEIMKKLRRKDDLDS